MSAEDKGASRLEELIPMLIVAATAHAAMYLKMVEEGVPPEHAVRMTIAIMKPSVQGDHDLGFIPPPWSEIKGDA